MEVFKQESDHVLLYFIAQGGNMLVYAAEQLSLLLRAVNVAQIRVGSVDDSFFRLEILLEVSKVRVQIVADVYLTDFLDILLA